MSSANRVSIMPNIPTVAESGFPKFDVVAWAGFVAPAGTPQPIIDKVNDAVRKAGQSPEVKQWLIDNGSPTDLGSTPAEFGNFLQKELAFWKQAVDASGAKAD